jgi:hypothetical protein
MINVRSDNHVFLRRGMPQSVTKTKNMVIGSQDRPALKISIPIPLVSLHKVSFFSHKETRL